jgi:hypothetical protein
MSTDTATRTATPTHCPAPRCGAPLAEHIGGRPCVVGRPHPERTALHHLPIYGRMADGDAR